jgi:predicted DNA-binding antitoxin AbrB/MazE fold protein
MIRHIDAIFSQGALQPLEPLTLPEGPRVHLRLQELAADTLVPSAARIHTPRLANPEHAADFVMEVRETGDASL